MENGTDQNQGVADESASVTADQGGQGNEPSSSSTPSDQGGTQPDSRDEENKRLREEVKRLNQHIVDSRRNSLKQGQSQQDPSKSPQNTPNVETEQGQYTVALTMAENNLRSRLEEILPLYPELKDFPQIQNRIRVNPWAFASREAFLTGNWELAAMDIEQSIADEVERLSQKSQTVPSQEKPAPATVNNNPVPQPNNSADLAIPGSVEDQNPWTMPMDKLERLAYAESKQSS